MNMQEEMSSISSPTPSAVSVVNKIVKTVALSHNSYECDQLGGRTAAAMHLELSSDRKNTKVMHKCRKKMLLNQCWKD